MQRTTITESRATTFILTLHSTTIASQFRMQLIVLLGKCVCVCVSLVEFLEHDAKHIMSLIRHLYCDLFRLSF